VQGVPGRECGVDMDGRGVRVCREVQGVGRMLGVRKVEELVMEGGVRD
jgi:hypothetical protein